MSGFSLTGDSSLHGERQGFLGRSTQAIYGTSEKWRNEGGRLIHKPTKWSLLCTSGVLALHHIPEGIYHSLGGHCVAKVN